jgi:hypothetical protein
MILYLIMECSLLYILQYKLKKIKIHKKYGKEWDYKYYIKKDLLREKILKNIIINCHLNLFQNIQMINYLLPILILIL